MLLCKACKPGLRKGFALSVLKMESDWRMNAKEASSIISNYRRHSTTQLHTMCYHKLLPPWLGVDMIATGLDQNAGTRAIEQHSCTCRIVVLMLQFPSGTAQSVSEACFADSVDAPNNLAHGNIQTKYLLSSTYHVGGLHLLSRRLQVRDRSPSVI